MSTLNTAALLPIAAMVGLTAVVAGAMLAQRIAEMRERRISPRTIASSVQSNAILERVNCADNFRNLFEAPVLFYVLCLALTMTQLTSPWMLAAAWLYVGLRVLHSAIHCTTNRVKHRFRAYAASSAVLVGMWIVFAAMLINAS